MSEKVIYFCTCGGDDAEKASICFAMAGAAIALELDVTVALQGRAVHLAQKGYTNNVPATGGFAPLSKLIGDFLELGGTLLACKPCIEDRNIEESDLIEGCEVTSGGNLNLIAIGSDAQMVY